jgi:teichuronic acid biosynthesis glycosyltransferase TuaG|tara:strand:- start:3 stop:851 length:849 start_codon:yes stop_codon:yes gene_type:complete
VKKNEILLTGREKVQPLVTVITPLFNAQNFIGETIKSVLGQTYQNWEMIIIDDCSTDNSRDIVKEYETKDSRIKLIELKKNFGGPARPRNIGLDISNGDYLAFLDADDVWLENKLQVQINEMLINNLDFTSTDSKFIDDNSIDTIINKYKIVIFFKKIKRKATLSDVIKGNFIRTSSAVISKNFISKFDENKDFIGVEDIYLWMKILNDKNIRYKYITEKLIKYRISSTSLSERGANEKQALKANLCILKFILDNQKFDYIKYFYIRIIKLAFIYFIKKIIK